MKQVTTYITENDFNTLRWKESLEFTVGDTIVTLKYLKEADDDGKKKDKSSD